MTKTYKAVQVREPGKLNLVELPILEPGPGQVRIRVEACGVSHSDAATVEGQYPGLTFPRVPGHEVVGRIDAVGRDVTNWKIGQRVGVGFFGGQDGQCQSCQRGDFVNCLHPVVTGITVDGFHRIIHALLDGKELIAAQSFKELPAEAFATPKRRQKEAESSAGAFSRCYV
jgi:D-arabinose 1-dehydrogenase-like Zn-dependent alcohol dehydrogenase